MKTTMFLAVAAATLCLASAQDIHVHTPWPVLPPAPQPPVARPPTPVNHRWEREKMRLEHEYRMRELKARERQNSAGRVEDEISMPSAEQPRRWHTTSGRLLFARLVSYNRKTDAVKLSMAKGGMVTTLSELSSDDQLYVLKRAIKLIP